MAWWLLIVAGLLEVVWAYAMKQSEGFTRLRPAIVTAVAMLASVTLLSWSMKTLPLGTAYTVWTASAPSAPFSSALSPSPSRRVPCDCSRRRSSSRGWSS
jgi:quaternary ammonium compound-resistance protein SugE